MDTLHLIVKSGVYILMAVSVLAAFGAVSLPNIFHAALSVIVALLGVAGIFIALGAEFLAVVQILLYVGAIMTLVIFSIMMTERIADKNIPQKNNLSLPALGAVILFFILVTRVLLQTPWAVNLQKAAHVSLKDLGGILLTQYVFPFEVISVFLVAVLIGAIVIAKKDQS